MCATYFKWNMPKAIVFSEISQTAEVDGEPVKK